LQAIIEREGFETIVASGASDSDLTREAASTIGASWIVADSYDFDTAYLATLGGARTSVLAIDDLARQRLPVDVVVNGALGAEDIAYEVPLHCRLLLGSSYALLRAEFNEEPGRRPDRVSRKVLVTLGGGDPGGLSRRLARAASDAGADSIDVVIGPLLEISPRELADLTGVTSVNVYQNPESMRSLMLAADVALCGGGQTLYELAATATPALAIRIADNQTANLTAFHADGIAKWIGDADDPALDDRVVTGLRELFSDPRARASMGDRGRLAVDGNGANRVAGCLEFLARDEERPTCSHSDS
jgi:spore coat polysaccharide biosynthesis predicted glycosyltransferase SpsG